MTCFPQSQSIERNIMKSLTMPVVLFSLVLPLLGGELELSVDKTALNKESNTTYTLTVKDKNGKTETVTENIEWIITPKDAVKIEENTITAKKDTDVTIRARYRGRVSNPVTLHIYWEVDGHRLPPEPDPKINNATLLGVDVNNNGVRDDVERKVYATYKKAIERAVMMQAFKTAQAMLADPDLIKNAREWEKKDTKAMDCDAYLYLNKNKPFIKNMGKIINNWQINTEERIKKYFKYDQALSGGVYSITDGTLQDCEFDVEKVLEMDR